MLPEARSGLHPISTICKLHSCQISRWAFMFATMVGRKIGIPGTPVGSKLHSEPQYKAEFLAPDDAAFVYFLFAGNLPSGSAEVKVNSPTSARILSRKHYSTGIEQMLPITLQTCHSLQTILAWHLIAPIL